MKTITLDKPCIGTVIRDERPYVKILSVPIPNDLFNETATCLAQVNDMLCLITVKLTELTEKVD